MIGVIKSCIYFMFVYFIRVSNDGEKDDIVDQAIKNQPPQASSPSLVPLFPLPPLLSPIGPLRPSSSAAQTAVGGGKQQRRCEKYSLGKHDNSITMKNFDN